MSPRSVINFFRSTKTGAFILFLAVFGGGFVLVMGFTSKGSSAPSTEEPEIPTREESQIVETITRDMILFDPPGEIESEPNPVPYEPETKEETPKGWRHQSLLGLVEPRSRRIQ